MSRPFPVARDLLNPKFEGYKLRNIDEHQVFRCPLPASGVTRPTIASGTQLLSFEEMQYRIKYNHLSLGPNVGELFYIDRENEIIVIGIGEEGTRASFTPIRNTSHSSYGGFSHQNAFPAVVALGNGLWLRADGSHTFEITTLDGSSQHFLYQCTERQDYEASILLLNGALAASGEVLVLFAHRILALGAAEHPPDSATTIVPTFHVVCASLKLSSNKSNGQFLSILWSRRASSIPLASWYDPIKRGWLLMGTSSYDTIKDINPYRPKPDEFAPIPRPGEQLDTVLTSTRDAPPPLPYSWTQTNDSVTIAFGLPSDIRPSAIRLILATKDLSLLVSAKTPGFPLPRYTKKAWWASIDASASFWTWDKEGERQKSEESEPSVGLLTLHLEKLHEGTRWPHVFESMGMSTMDPADIEVPETLDPSEVWHIREALEKYTNSMMGEGNPGRGGLGSGLPSLSQGEYDEEVDAMSGTPIRLSWIGTLGDDESDGTIGDVDASLLSLPLPIDKNEDPSFIIKNDVDGLLYSESSPRDEGIDQSQLTFNHVATFSALAFVLASKRNLRYVFHVSAQVVLAFEGSASLGFGENVYIYRAAQGKNDRTAEQSILKLGGGSAGSIVGACGIRRLADRVDLVCLCENELVIVKDIC